MQRGATFIAVLAIIAIAVSLRFSAYRILYSDYSFSEYDRITAETVPVEKRKLVTCHYFSGTSLEYAVVPADQRRWCERFCRPAPAAQFRGMMQPGYRVADGPICRG